MAHEYPISTELSDELNEAMFSRHSHAEIVNDEDPDQVVYREKDVIEIIRIALKRS